MMSLRRLYWRFRHGLLRRETLQSQIGEEASTLVTDYRRYHRSLGTALEQPVILAVCRLFDDCLNGARASTLAGDFKASLQGISDAHCALNKLRAAGAAAQEANITATLCQQISELLHYGPLCSFPTVEVLRRLTFRSQESFGTGEFSQSGFTATMANREAERLLAVSTLDRDVVDELGKRLDSLAEMCTKLDATLPWLADLDIAHQCIGTIRELAHAHRITLADNLAEDLACWLAPPRDFLNELERQVGPLDRLSKQDIDTFLSLCDVSFGMNWDEAAKQLVESSLRALSARLSAFHSQHNLDLVRAALADHSSVHIEGAE